MADREPRLGHLIRVSLFVVALLLLASPYLVGCAGQTQKPTPSTTEVLWAYRYQFSSNRTIDIINAYTKPTECEVRRAKVASNPDNTDVSSCHKVFVGSSSGTFYWTIRTDAGLLGVTDEATCRELRYRIVTQRRIQVGTCESTWFINAD